MPDSVGQDFVGYDNEEFGLSLGVNEKPLENF